MANNQRQLAAIWAVTDGNADIARRPRFNRNPRVQLSIIQSYFTLVVNDQPAVIGLGAGVELHDGKTAPNAVFLAGALETGDLWPVEPAHEGRVGVHAQPMQRVFRKHHQVHARKVSPCFADQTANPIRLPCQIIRRCHHRVLQLNQANDHTARRFVQTSQTAHQYSFPYRARFADAPCRPSCKNLTLRICFTVEPSSNARGFSSIQIGYSSSR